MTATGTVSQVQQINRQGPLPLQWWKATVTVPGAATTVSVTSPYKMSGVVAAVWIDPTTLTAAATIKGYCSEDVLTTPDYFLNYTVPNPAVETHSALAASKLVFGTITVDVALATAADSFVLYVLVDPNGAAPIAAGTNNIGDVDVASITTPTVPAETVVAGAASTLGKIGTVAAAAILYVRAPCALTSPATSRVLWRVSCNKAHTLNFFRARSILNAPTITLASVAANDTVIINGLTFTAHASTTTVANREFNIGGGTDTLDAAELVTCINNVTYGVPGLTAAAPAAVVTLTATTATTTQAATGVGGARIVCAQAILASLSRYGSAIAGLAANNTMAGVDYEVYADGYPHMYLSITNDDGGAAATVVIGATLLPQ